MLPWIFSLFLLSFAFTANGGERSSLVLIGKIPGAYLNLNPHQSHLGYLKIEGRTIEDLQALDASSIESKKREFLARGSRVLILQRGDSFDVIYPGLIDLHGHNKQNVIPTWETAYGRFANRYEWRMASNEYKQVQSRNMNPWVQNPVAELAAYRWSELQAMVLGTTYLQGSKYYDLGFSIQSVEDPSAFISSRMRIDSSGDIVDPFYWSFLWNVLRPIQAELNCSFSYDCYKRSLAHFLIENCKVEVVDLATMGSEIADGSTLARVPQWVIDNLGDERAVQWLQVSRDSLVEACPLEKSEEMLQFLTKLSDNVNLPHSEIIEKNNYLDNPNRGAIITHIAEGRRQDPASWTEFQLLKLAGLAREGMNFIHGNALTQEDFQYMAEHNMGLVWSPYSNFLLYGETVDIKTALEQGVRVSLGSDWTPTGSKGVLEELKVATDYLQWQGIEVSDQVLYEMVTKNSAQTMNHYGFEKRGEQGIGTLEKGAMGTVIVVQENHPNPYTNLVRHAAARDINLVVIDGEPLYGNRSYMESVASETPLEDISGRLFDLEINRDRQAFPPTLGYGRLAEVGDTVAAAAAKIDLGYSTACQFDDVKVGVIKKSHGQYDPVLNPILHNYGLDLNSYSGITRFLGIALLSQSYNVKFDGTEAQLAPEALRLMPPLYSCEDNGYLNYLTQMAQSGTENTIVKMAKARSNSRIDAQLTTFLEKESPQDRGTIVYSIPYQLAILYGLAAPIEIPLAGETFVPIIDVPLNP